MNVVQTITAVPPSTSTAVSTRVAMIGVLRTLLLVQAGLALALAIVLSLLAAELRDFLGGDLGRNAEVMVRFAAAAAFLFAIFAAIAARGARRRRAWSWTMAAVLQLILAIGTGIAVMTAEWHPAYLAGFGLAAAVMLVLSTTPVRRALDQG